MPVSATDTRTQATGRTGTSAVHPPETVEDLRLIFDRNADARIRDCDAYPAIGPTAQTQRDLPPSGGVGNRIADQIEQQLLEPVGVA